MDVGRSYREAAVRGASPVELVVRLYEQMIEDLRQAVKAFDQNDVEVRTNKINHAILVLGHLQSQLDFASGGNVACDLENFYNVLRHNLMQAQAASSKPLLSQQITDVLTVREAWIEVQRTQNASAAPPAEADRSHLDWKV